MEVALRAIADPSRREILRLVSGRELPACKIAAHFAVTRPCVSQHLQVLVMAGLLDMRRNGTQRLYRARKDKLEELRQFLSDFWDESLSRLAAAAETEERSKTHDAS